VCEGENAPSSWQEQGVGGGVQTAKAKVIRGRWLPAPTKSNRCSRQRLRKGKDPDFILQSTNMQERHVIRAISSCAAGFCERVPALSAAALLHQQRVEACSFAWHAQWRSVLDDVGTGGVPLVTPRRRWTALQHERCTAAPFGAQRSDYTGHCCCLSLYGSTCS